MAREGREGSGGGVGGGGVFRKAEVGGSVAQNFLNEAGHVCVFGVVQGEKGMSL